jgi:hypothetical protein
LFGGISIHPIGLMHAEEDEWLMVHIGISQLLMFFFPVAGQFLNPLVLFDCVGVVAPDKGTPSSRLPMAMRDICIFKYYSECVQRHLYYYEKLHPQSSYSRTKKIFVSKNPAFTLRLESLYARFPDARVVCMIRNPRESIPSMVSYIAKVLVNIYFY